MELASFSIHLISSRLISDNPVTSLEGIFSIVVELLKGLAIHPVSTILHV
jgi:hypothetical protein